MSRTYDRAPSVAAAAPAVVSAPKRAAAARRLKSTEQLAQRLTGVDEPVQHERVDAGYGDLIEAAKSTVEIHQAARRGTSGPGSPLPHLDAIQKSFGRHDVTGVVAHTDGAAARASHAIGARAYTTANHVAFAGMPSLHTAAHEAAHAIQQQKGVQLAGAVGEAGDRYERHADAVAATVVRGASAEALLNEHAAPAAPAIAGGRPTQREAIAPSEDVIQLVRLALKGINGLTHLVRMTHDEHLYSRDYRANEGREVTTQDVLLVDEEMTFLSRRGINQEVNAERDEATQPSHLWIGTLRVNNEPQPSDTYAREEMLKDPVTILVPRPRDTIDAMIGTIRGSVIQLEKERGKEIYPLNQIINRLTRLKGGLVKTSADSVLDFDALGQLITESTAAVEGTLKANLIDQSTATRLSDSLTLLRQEFQRYRAPKQGVAAGGRIGRATIERFGYQGIDLGGIGGRAHFLDVNVEDTTNNPNHLVIGDAMNLPAYFEPQCVPYVNADLLPLVLMVHGDSVENRCTAIRSVLAGVVYVCTGHASIEFNDNSGEFAVSGERLGLIAAEFKFTLSNPMPSHTFRRMLFTK